MTRRAKNLDSPSPISLSRLIVAAAGTYAIAGGILTLAGWALDIQRFTDWTQQGISMFVNTAICAMLGGAALLCRLNRNHAARRWTPVFGTVLALIAGLTLFEHLSGINLGIDTLLGSRPWGQAAAAAPMRMGPPASVSFAVIGIALVLVSRERKKFSALTSGVGVVVGAVALLSVIGYVYGAKRLYSLPHLTGIAMQTATMLFALGAGLIATTPNSGIAATIRRRDAGGMLMRRLLLPTLTLPVIAGFVLLAGEHARLYDPAFGVALFVLVMIGSFIGLLVWTARGLSQVDRVRRRHERALRAAEHVQRLLLESERAARTEAEHAARSKDLFLATVSHELRSPLNTISGWAQLLRRISSDNPAVLEASGAIEAAVRNQARIIDDLLDVHRSAAGKFHLDVSEVDLAQIISSAVDGVRPELAAKGIELEMQLNPRTGRIMGDAVRLQQVVSNLLSNALKFTPRSGRVSVTLDRIGSDVKLSVRDTGAGIKAEFLPRVFDPFTQADSSIARRHGGLGLGLAIVKSIVELHRGSVAVESAGEGTGATFSVRLPLMIAASDPPNECFAQGLEALDLSRVRILVADDDRSAAEVLSRLLSTSQAEVRLAHAGLEALMVIQDFEPDILFCDISMPDLDGYEVMRRLRKTGNRVPAVAITAFTRDEDKVRALEAGFNAHLSKPVDAHELLKVLDSLVLVEAGGLSNQSATHSSTCASNRRCAQLSRDSTLRNSEHPTASTGR